MVLPILLLSFVQTGTYIMKVVISQISIGIDFGGSYIKVAYVSVGKPVETVLDRNTHRKTISYIGFKDEYLVFSDAAKAHDRRNPDCVIKNIDRLLGRRFDDKSIVRYRRQHPHLKLVKDETDGGILVVFEKQNITMKPIELFALMLDEIHEYSSAYTNYNVSDFSIAFPPIIDQARAHAVKVAAKLSKMKLLEILDTPTTIMTNYIVMRKRFLNVTSQLIMIVDIGSSNTVVTISRVGLEPGSKKNTTMGSYNITATSYVDVGAADFDEVLAQMMMIDFKTKSKISDDIAAIYKVKTKFVEQGRNAKHCLTSSKECHVSIDEAHNDRSYRTAITREDLRKEGSSILEKVGDAIQRAMLFAKITPTNLSEVIIMGGGSLIPAFQEIIIEKTGRAPGRVLNTDESNAAGASLLSAKAHGLFKIAEFKAPYFLYYPIEIEYNVSVRDMHGENTFKHQKEVLYPTNARQSAKKLLTITNVTGDFVIHVRYAKLPETTFSDLDQYDILDVHINNISEVLSNHSEHIPRHLAVHFRIDEFKMLTVRKVDYLFEKNQSTSIFGKVGKAVMNLLGMGSNNTNTSDTSNETIATSNGQEDGATKAADVEAATNNNTSPPPPTPEMKSSEKNFSVDIPFVVEKLYLKPSSKEEFIKSKEKIAAIHNKEKVRVELAKARSDLESGIFENEQTIDSEEFSKYFTEEDKERFINTTSRVRTEFEENGRSYDIATLKSKLTELRSAADIPRTRKEEARNVERQVTNLKNLINSSMNLITEVYKKQEFAKLVNETILLDTLNKTLSTQKWLDKKIKQQAALNLTEERVLTSLRLVRKSRELEESLSVLYEKIQAANDLLAKIQKQINDKTLTSEDLKQEPAQSLDTEAQALGENEEIKEDIKTDTTKEDLKTEL